MKFYKILILATKTIVFNSILYITIYFSVNFIEDNLTSNSVVSLGILLFSLPASFFLNYWVLKDLSSSKIRKYWASLLAIITSPCSSMIWLTIYTNIVGYHG